MTQQADGRVIALAGNPNVGKSTLFNALTGLRQHTGNWPGKTVEVARGQHVHRGRSFQLVDLPGTYSLNARSAEEEVTRDYLSSGQADGVIVVCDATCLERSLLFALQVMEYTGRVVVCVNLMDEAQRYGLHIDLAALARRLGVEVVGTSAGREEGIESLMDAVERVSHPHSKPPRCLPTQTEQERADLARQYAAAAVRRERPDPMAGQRRLDRLLTSKSTGIPLMLLMLGFVLWLTIAAANVPSQMLSQLLFGAGE